MTEAPRTTLPFLATVVGRQIAEIGVGTGETSLVEQRIFRKIFQLDRSGLAEYDGPRPAEDPCP